MVSDCPFKSRCEINHFTRRGVSFVFLLQIWHIFYGVSKVYMMPLYWVRHHFRESIRLRIGHLKHSRHISHCVFGHHFTKRHNIRHSLKPVFIRTIFNHFIAPGILDIRIDIRHANPVWIQKPLKQQIIFQRI